MSDRNSVCRRKARCGECVAITNFPMIFPLRVDLTADIVQYDEDSLQARIKWNASNSFGLYKLCRYFLIIHSTGQIISHPNSRPPPSLPHNTSVDRTLDVRLSPVPSEYCSINPCVAYGLKAVSTNSIKASHKPEQCHIIDLMKCCCLPAPCRR